MMQNLTMFTKDKNSQESVFSRGFFLSTIRSEKDDYLSYKLGSLENVSEERLQEMEVIEVLEKLGFPLDSVGTYLFKDMIVKAMKELDGRDAFGREISPDELLQQMKSPFSQFYVDVARNDLDMGIKTFHSHMERTLEEVDYAKADATLLYEIYSNFSEETDYGEHAFIIAKHMREANLKKAFQYKKECVVIPANIQVSI